MNATSTTIVVATVGTPVGPVRVAERDGRVVCLAFADQFDRVSERLRQRFPEDPWTEGRPLAAEAIRRYVAGDLGALVDLDVDADGTDFQRRVWAALRRIPTGETRTYGQIAAEIGSPGAVRAVGAANGANPVWLAVPCHRVVRSDGSLGGYGGGSDRKAWLLAHEGVTSVMD